MGSTSHSGKGSSTSAHAKSGHAKSGHADADAAAAKAKKIKLIFAIVVLAVVPVWLIWYFDPFEMRKPEPGPPQDAYLEQLPEPERERARKQAERTQELIDSGVKLPQPSGE